MGELDLTAQANAAQTATNYISADSTGIRIANSNPATATTYQHQTATETEFIVSGVSRAEISGGGARFGKEYVSGATDNESHMELDYHSLQLVDKEGNAYLYVSDLRGPDGSMLVEWESELTYVQALSTASMGLILPPTTYQTSIITENIVSVVAHTPSGDVDITNYVNASSSSASELVFTSLPTLGTFTRATATATYHTSDRRVKALTYGSRKTPEDIGVCSSVLGWENDASGLFSHAHGNGCVASGVASNAEGGETEAVADYSHAEGRSSGTGKYAYCGHAEGCNTHANAHSAHSEGYRTIASGEYAHAEGIDSTASGNSSHAEGNNTSATKPYAHAEGRATQATFDGAHAQNLGTIAAKRAQTAIGTFNVEDTSSGTTHPSGDSNAGQFALIIGNGTADDARSNALTVGWDGTVTTARDILVTSTSGMSGIMTAASGITIDIFKFCQRSNVASILLRAKKSTMTAANTAISVGTVVADRRPPFECAGPGTSGVGDCWVDDTGSVKFRSTSQIAANANFYVRVTYPVA